jgi:uncharacterized protein (TIGR03437 family)
MNRKLQQIRSRLFLAMVILGLLSYVVLPSFLIQPTKVSAFGLSPISEMEGTVFAVTAGGNLINFNAITPGAINRSVAITGLQSGESILGIDFRPRTGQLFALSSASRLYTINTTTGAATAVGTAPFTPALNGTAFGFDFNPVPDRIRLVSDAEQNLRLNPNDGTVAGTDTNLAFDSADMNSSANPNVVASAYTNNFSGASTTTLFGIDSNLNALVRQGSAGGAPTSPNAGVLFTIGALGVDTTDQVGFDIAAPGDVALASLTVMGGMNSSLYSINLTSGTATLIGAIGVMDTVRDIAVVTRVETIFALTAGNNLLSFNSGTPGQIASTRSIAGLMPGEVLQGIDFRPATGQLFAVSNANRVYTINTTSGLATPVSGTPLATPLNGTAFGFDFNPQPDRIRVVSNARQNLRLNPNDGTVAGTDTTLAFAAMDMNSSQNPNVVGAAYTDNVAGTTTTTLYVIDSNLDILALQGSVGGTPNSPNGGQLTTVGALGVNTNDSVGFDIAPQTGAAFASLTTQDATSSTLYTVNLTPGAMMAATTAIGTIGGGEVIRDIAVGVRVETVFAVTAGNVLVSFNSLTPGTILSRVPISGLQMNENVLGIDFRPASGQLFALGSTSRLYTINLTSGAATAVGTAPFTPALNGTSFGFDFNPVPDRIRLVSDAEQDLRLNPNDGTVAGTDTNLAFAAMDMNSTANPNVVGAAYTNNFAGSMSTTLYVIDSNLDILARQGSPGGSPVSPNSGQLFTVGGLGMDTTDQVGFDIADCWGTAYASLTTAGMMQSQLVRINLLTGAATPIAGIGMMGMTDVIRDIAIATNFVPSAQNAGIGFANAASFAGDVIAPESIAAIFGAFQTTGGQPASTTSLPLPTTLGGMSVAVNGVPAGLFFASNAQVNFLVPDSVNDGLATVTVTNANMTTRSGSIFVVRAAPGIFSANATGTGTAAALTTFDGITFLNVLNTDGTERLVDPGTNNRPNFLILFATGVRRTPGATPGDSNGVAEAVNVTIGGIPAGVDFAGPVSNLAGVDQLNVRIPPQLAGAGKVNVRMVVNGQASNTVTFSIGTSQP